MDDQHEFTIGGTRYQTSRRAFTERLVHVAPEPIAKYSVEIGARRYPVKQAVGEGLDAPRLEFTTQEAVRVLRKLGFAYVDETRRPASVGGQRQDDGPGLTYNQSGK